MNNRRLIAVLLAILLGMTVLTGCGADNAPAEQISIEDEAVPMADSIGSLLVMASGANVKSGNNGLIDYSNVADGYVMTKYTVESDKRLKVQVKGPTTTYTYNLESDDEWDTFPLSDGNGSYTVTIYKNISGTKYSTVTSVTFDAELKDEFAPFIRPNQYVDYDIAVKTKAKAKSLCKNKKTTLKKVAAVYDWVIKNITYDKQKAKTVQSGYLPVLDDVIASKTGICFDYASLMTGMLRSQGVACKLIVGYAGTAYHAWISVYVEGTGWVDGAIYFDGISWQRMDPTFASTGKQSASIMKYIGDGKNYKTKYIY